MVSTAGSVVLTQPAGHRRWHSAVSASLPQPGHTAGSGLLCWLLCVVFCVCSILPECVSLMFR